MIYVVGVSVVPSGQVGATVHLFVKDNTLPVSHTVHVVGVEVHSTQPMHGTQVPDSSTDPAGQVVSQVPLYSIFPASQLVHVVTVSKQV